MTVEPPRQPTTSATLEVAVIASSGGGTATLGHTDPCALLQCIDQQLRLVGGRVRHALYVSLDGGKSLDSANERVDRATLYRVDRTDKDCDHRTPSPESNSVLCEVDVVQRGTLQHVNEYCQTQQTHIAESIRRGTVHGLICISCHTGIFYDVLDAAAQAQIPVTGSGGTSLASAAAIHDQLVLVGNAGGSVATTTLTRAVSYTHALATHHRINYRPWTSNAEAGGPRWNSVLTACLPAFWGVCLAKWAVQGMATIVESRTGPESSILDWLSNLLQGLEYRVLPTACSVVMVGAASDSKDAVIHTSQSSLWMAAVVASSACSGSVLAGLLAGYLVALWSPRLLFWCIVRGVPATMTNLLTGGGVGAAVALLLLPLAPHTATLSQRLREWILSSIACWPTPGYRMVAGALWGLASCYGSKVGYYHAIHLPLILLELEHGTPSFLGAVDELTLVLVCAGVCLGNVAAEFAVSRQDSGRRQQQQQQRPAPASVALSWRGLRTNLYYGDFVECCYPFMEASHLVNAGGYLGSALSVAWLVREADSLDRIPRSLAYLPWPMAVALAGSQWRSFLGPSLLAAGIPFLATCLTHTGWVVVPVDARGPKQD